MKKIKIKTIFSIITIMVTNLIIILGLTAQTEGNEGRGLNFFGGQNITIYNEELGNVIAPITEEGSEEGSILHVGSHRIFGIGPGLGQGDIEGIVGSSEEIETYDIALTKILTVTQNVVNYTLGLIGVITVIYMIIHGFMVLTAAGDDSRSKKGMKGIKNAFIAIAGISLSRIIISFILRLINTFSA